MTSHNPSGILWLQNPQSQDWENQSGTVAGYTHTHTRLTALCPGLPGSAGTRKVKPIWILLKQETVGGNGISWAICKFAPRSRQITTPAPHHSVFYRPDALPAAQPTASKHWRHWIQHSQYLHSQYCAARAWCSGLLADDFGHTTLLLLANSVSLVDKEERLRVRGDHRHRIDKYLVLDTRCPITTAADLSPPIISKSHNHKMADCPSYYYPIPA